MNSFIKIRLDFFIWKIIFTISATSLLIIELVKYANRIKLAAILGDYLPVAVHSAILAIIVLVVVFMWKNQKRAPFFLSFVIFFNFFNTNIVQLEGNSLPDYTLTQIIGMPEFVFILYIGLNAFLIIAMVVYYFTDYLFGDILRYKDVERNKVFEAYLENLSNKRKVAEEVRATNTEDIWRE